MTKLFTLLAFTLSTISMVSCGQESGDDIVPNPDDDVVDYRKIIEGTYLETQYKLPRRLGSSAHNRKVWVYDSVESITAERELGPYFYIDYLGYHEEFDPIFDKYDDAYFEDHLLFCGFVDLPENGQLYLKSFSDEPVTDEAVDKGNKSFYKLWFEEVFDSKDTGPETITEVREYDTTLWFVEYEIPDGSTVAAEYTSHKNNPITRAGAPSIDSDNTRYWRSVKYRSQEIFGEDEVEEEETPVED